MEFIERDGSISFQIIEKNDAINETESFLHGSIKEEENSDNYVRSMFHMVLVIFGLSANVIVATVICGNRSMHTASNCYVFSIIISDFVVLSDIIYNVFRRWFKLSRYIDASYVDFVTLESSVLTIVIFSLERYVSLSPLRSESFNFSNGVKTVLIIWAISATFPAMELNLYLHFLPDTQALIFMMSTTMFLLLPTLVIIILAIFILIDTKNLKNNVDRDVSSVFVALTVVFYVSMAPYRIVSLVRFMAPTLYCSQTILNSSYLIVELSAAVNPILYGFVSNHFRTAFKETLRSFCASNLQPTDDRTCD